MPIRNVEPQLCTTQQSSASSSQTRWDSVAGSGDKTGKHAGWRINYTEPRHIQAHTNRHLHDEYGNNPSVFPCTVQKKSLPMSPDFPNNPLAIPPAPQQHLPANVSHARKKKTIDWIRAPIVI